MQYQIEGSSTCSIFGAYIKNKMREDQKKEIQQQAKRLQG